MKTTEEFTKEGYIILACSSNGCFHLTSYIAKKKIKGAWRKIYGYYDYQKEYYREEFI